MKYLLSFKLLLILALGYSLPVSADHNAHTVMLLNEAESTLYTDPQNTVQLVDEFFANLTPSNNLNQLAASFRSDGSRRIRTPVETLQGFNLKAKALLQLSHPNAALHVIDQALIFANNKTLSHQKICSLLIKARIIGLYQDNIPLAMQIISSANTNIELIGTKKERDEFKSYSLLIESQIAFKLKDYTRTESLYQQLNPYINSDISHQLQLRIALSQGITYTSNQQYLLATEKLLTAYQIAIKERNNYQLANINVALSTLYKKQQILPEAIAHAIKAASYYEQQNLTYKLSKTLTLLADIYQHQGRLNFALVHYLNAIDLLDQSKSNDQILSLKIRIAKVYLQLYNYTLSERYITNAIELTKNSHNDKLLAQSHYVYAGVLLATQKPQQAIKQLKSALTMANQVNAKNLIINIEEQLILTYESEKEFDNAFAISRDYIQHITEQSDLLKSEQLTIFKKQNAMLTQDLYIKKTEQQNHQLTLQLEYYKNIIITLVALIILLVGAIINRYRANQNLHKELKLITKDLYTHPRSSLNNLRFLSEKLPASLKKSSANFEQWHLGELIQEPNKDKLNFALVNIEFLKQIYLDYGYEEALKIEEKFGAYLLKEIQQPARIYHISDTLLLYVEPSNINKNNVSNRLTHAINNFEPNLYLNRKVSVGLAEYPFLPRAYTAINDQQLIDILLLAMESAQTLTKKTKQNQWIRLTAIDATPAAIFSQTQTRDACLSAIDKGFIKIQCSSNEKIMWPTRSDYLINDENQ
ncbi:hypothetical protein L0B53_04695 [Vibrio sp. SS-MA-C1-2]|uniref:hypothetical protein n=1 Tax=Vibrio sp. SS-MA-C1-2 TaxID=2908646 RepID=UPI001F1F18C6|nr:hypothetical protein [Vibrio sp. SS-MA-C1-2]UJF18913.1 hypothetical protein L0B53_04695 [Vibrio sp. SS-MA-C1-2]